MNKQGMQLAINSLVVIILGIVLIGVGITFVLNVVEKGEELLSSVDEKLIEEMRRTHFRTGTTIAVLNPQEELKHGKSAYHLLGYVNKAGEQKQFSVYVEFNDLRSDIGIPITGTIKADAQQQLLYDPSVVTLEPNEDNFAWLLFTSNKDLPRGRYVYDIYVCYDGSSPDGACLLNRVAQGTTSAYENKKERLYITVR